MDSRLIHSINDTNFVLIISIRGKKEATQIAKLIEWAPPYMDTYHNLLVWILFDSWSRKRTRAEESKRHSLVTWIEHDLKT